MTAASEILVIVLVPLLVVRLIALPRVREQAVTLGWLAGCLLRASLPRIPARTRRPRYPETVWILRLNGGADALVRARPPGRARQAPKWNGKPST
jgi:hypothetical protein